MNKLALLLRFVMLGLCSVGQAIQIYPCRTKEENQIFKADCANHSLPNVPVYLPTKTWLLNLEHNKLELWRPLSHFNKYVNLHNLTLGNNSLTSIHNETFKSLEKLVHLDLWGNRLNEVPSAALSELRALRTLSLEGNNIRIIHRDAFYNLNNLTQVKLSGNHIFRVDAGALSGLIKLQHFEIQHNNLLSLPPLLFQDCERNLKTLLLYSNPWHCDCQIRWLVNYIKSINMSWSSKMQIPRCDTPIQRNKVPFLSVPKHLFACQVLMDSSSIKIDVEKGKNITLTCKVQSDPLANITWFFNDRLLEVKNGYSVQEHGAVNNQNSLLFIENLNFRNAGQYKCLARNPISHNFVTYTLAVEGVLSFPPLKLDKKMKAETDNSSITIAVVTVCVLIAAIVFSVLAFIIWRRFAKIQKEKEEAVKLKIKMHFESNGDCKLDADNNKCPPDMQMDNDEMDSFYDSLKKPLGNMEPLFEKIGHLPNGGTYLSFRTDPLDSELNAPSTILTNLDSQSDTNGIYWNEVSRNDTSSNLSELACPLLDQPPAIYNTGVDYWDHNNSEVFSPHLYASTYPRHPGTFNSIHSFHPYTHDSSNSMTLNSPSNMENVYNRSFSVATSQSGSMEDNNKRSASVGSLGLVAIPPKKPPRLHSCSSISQSDTPNYRLTLPKPGSIDEFGTAV